MKKRTIERQCENCGKSFAVVPSRLKHGRGRYCSPSCQYTASKARPKKVLGFICIGCGAGFTRPISKKQKGMGKYCTRSCRDQHWIGSNNPNWQNGAGVYKRGPRWQSIRRKVLARDGACVCCGAVGRLHVHHKIPFRMFTDSEVANDLSNLIALCPPCHRKEDAKHKWVALSESCGILRFNAGGPAWQMALEKRMV